MPETQLTLTAFIRPGLIALTKAKSGDSLNRKEQKGKQAWPLYQTQLGIKQAQFGNVWSSLVIYSQLIWGIQTVLEKKKKKVTYSRLLQTAVLAHLPQNVRIN